MKKILILVLVLSLLTGCAFGGTDPTDTSTQTASSEPLVDPEFPVTVGDQTVYAAPKRVVSLSPTLTAVLTAYERDGVLVACSDYCESDGLKAVGTAAQPDLEAIVKLTPDYLLTTQPLSDEAIDLMQKNNITALTFTLPNTLAETAQLYADLLTLMGGDKEGRAYADEVKQAFLKDYETLKTQIATWRENHDEGLISVLYVYEPDLYVAGGGTFEENVLDYLGFSNAAGDYQGRRITAEALKGLNPHFLIFSKAVTMEWLEKSDAWRGKTAVKKDDAAFVDMTAVDLRAPSMFEVFARIAEATCPGCTDLNVDGTSSEPTSSEEVSSEPTSSEAD